MAGRPVVERAVHGGDELVLAVPDVLVVLAVLVARVGPVVQERHHQGVFQPEPQRVPTAPLRFQARDEVVAQQGPGARAIDKDVARLRHRERLVARHVTVDALDRTAGAGVDEVAERSLDRVERDEATRPFAQQAAEIGVDGAPEGQSCLELGGLEDGLDAVAVDGVGPVALDRVGDQIRGERHHARPGVPVSPVVEADRRTVHRLEECRQQQPDRSAADHADLSRWMRGHPNSTPVAIACLRVTRQRLVVDRRRPEQSHHTAETQLAEPRVSVRRAWRGVA